MLALLCIAICSIFPATAQEIKISGDLSSEIPFDPNVRKGVLDNGLTYYIRKNSKPEGRVELRLAVNAGSLLEDSTQLGLAHFTEHMAFNGTEHFEKNELIDVLQQAGVKFGAHLNAYTSFDETVYMLTMPTTDTTLEKGMQILEDWAGAIAFDSSEIDKERGVVIEEWRMGQGAQRRMLDQYLPVLLANSRYAERLPIGTKEVLESFDYETLRRFYENWYRPGLMAVIAVGDINPDSMEMEIKQRFGQLETPAEAPERKQYEVPDQPDTKVAVVTDKEASFNQISLYYKEDSEHYTTLKDYRQVITQQLFTGMLSQRLNELAQQADPPFMNAGAYYGSVVRSKDAYQMFAIVPPGGIERGLKTLLKENQRVKQYGFTQTELDRFKKLMLTQYERAYNERSKTESSRYASEYVNHFLEGEPTPGIAFEYKFMQEYLPGIKLEEINVLAQQWIKDQNRVVVVTAPEKEDVAVPDEDSIRALLKEMEDVEVDPYEDIATAEALMENVPEAGKITDEKQLDKIGVTELTFSNGIKAVLKPTDFKNNEILMTASSPGGYSLYSDSVYFSAANADGIITESGVKEFSKIDLQRYLSDKNASVSPYISSLQEGFNGNATPEDLETMLQLTYLYFTNPREDTAAFQSYVSKNKAIYRNILSNPQYYYYDKVASILSQNHPRGGGYPTVEDWQGVAFGEVQQTYDDRFKDASDFTFFFVGNFEVEKIKSLLATYLGSLPDTDRSEKWKDVGVRPPSGVVKEIVKKGTDPKSMVNITFTGEFDYTRQKAYELNSLIQALNIKLIEKVREEKSGVYSISARADADKYPYEHYSITISYPCAPENVDELTEAVFEQIKQLRQNGPTAADLQKVKEAQRREMETNLKENGFWLHTLENAYFMDQDPAEVLSYEERINQLNAEDLKEVADKYFNMDQYVKVVLYPENYEQAEAQDARGGN